MQSQNQTHEIVTTVATLLICIYSRYELCRGSISWLQLIESNRIVFFFSVNRARVVFFTATAYLAAATLVIDDADWLAGAYCR